MRRPPYAPFLAGAPEFVAGLKPIDPAHWLAPDVEAAALPGKRALMRAARADVFKQRDGTEAASAEVEAMVAAAAGAGADFDDPAPLMRAAAQVSDDLVVMLPQAGEWRTAALVLCSPTFFSAAHAIGRTLHGLHEPVPDRLGPNQTQALGQRIGRMFDALGADFVLERFNWTVQAGAERYTPDGAPLRALAAAADENEALDLVHLRVERQTIRRLPQSGGVAFTIRIALDPLRAVFADPALRAGFAAAWDGAPEHVRGYKKWAPYERLVRAALAASSRHEGRD